MHPFVDVLWVGALAGMGALLGLGCARLPRQSWTAGFVASAVLVVLFAACGQSRGVQSLLPISSLFEGRVPLALIGFVAALVLTTLASRVPRTQTMGLAFLSLVGIASHPSVSTFVSSVQSFKSMAALETRFDRNGICRQNTGYDCGPAAATTGLRCLGISAEERDIAVRARTCPAVGTSPTTLAQALERQYGNAGLHATYREFRNVAELKRACPTIALMKFTAAVDHYVTVLEVGEAEVTVGDPLRGKRRLPLKEFEDQWRKSGIALWLPAK